MKIILASQSPRRRELLERMGISGFEVRPARGEERMDAGLTPAELVEALSRQKAAEIAETAGAEDVIIAADTVVAIDGLVLGKPHDRAEAAEMLSRLSNRVHQVFSGLTVCQGQRAVTVHECTQVRFRKLSHREIEGYLDTGEPMDKAGAYGIQGYGAMLVESIAGDFYNVMGLPVCRLGQLLREFGVELLRPAGGQAR